MDGSQACMQLSCTESLLTASQYAKVIFHDVPDRYSNGQELECQFTVLAADFQTRFGDRIALFKLGWHSATEYHVFEWAPQVPPCTRAAVVFQACHLPRDDSQFYQFCYIDAENSTCGASVPFQFCSGGQQVVTARAAENNTCHACRQLKKQNQFLENTLSRLDKYDGQFEVLRKDMDGLKRLLEGTQGELSGFKTRLEMAGEEFKKLYLEKRRIERKYDKLVKKCLEAKRASTSESEELLGELAPLPAFPLPL